VTLSEGEDLDPRILALETAVAMHKGEDWASESALPGPKLELFELVRRRRSTTHREERIYQRLTSLMVDLTLFVPDADLADLEAARTFMGPGGQITGRRLDDPAESRQRDRSYEMLSGHKAERERLLSSVSIEAERRPIGEALWRRRGIRKWPYYDASRPEIGYVVHPTGAERDESPTKPLDDAGAAQAVLFLGWIPPLISAVICAAALWVIGRPEAAVITLVSGPIVGYVVCLTLLFAGGTAVRSIGASARVQERFIAVTILIGVPVAFAIAVLSVDPSLGLLAAGASIAWVVLVIAYDVVTS
jgi:hypothetical protein